MGADCAGCSEREDHFEYILAMIDDLLKEEQAVESAYRPFVLKSPITRAAEAKDHRLLEVLCLNGVSMNRPDGKWGSPLHVACELHRFENTEYLLRKYNGPLNFTHRLQNVLVKEEFFSDTHPEGLTLLDQAIQCEWPIFVWDLLRLGHPVVIEHYNLDSILPGIVQMLRIWSYFPHYLCWSAIKGTDGFADVIKKNLLPLLSDPDFLLAQQFNFVSRIE
jgi:hypothetical protein